MRQKGSGSPAGPEGENFAIARNISDCRKVLSPTRCGGSPLAEGAKRSTGDHTRISTPFSRKYRFKSLISTCFVWKIDAARPASTAG